jgi:hypothetical protein
MGQKKKFVVHVQAAPLDEVIENPKQKFIDRLHMTSTLFAKK